MKKILYILVFLTLCIGIDRISAYTEYKIGDIVKYNDIDFYVIKNSDKNEDSVTMLKKEPLTVDEVNTYGGVGTDHNHVNMNVSSNYSFYQRAYNYNGYGGMQYYSSSTCYSINNHWDYTGCLNDYSHSEVKYVVDAWANEKFEFGLKSARLLTYEELMDNLGYNYATWDASDWVIDPEYTPSWVYGNYRYWIGTADSDDITIVWGVFERGLMGKNYVYGNDLYSPLYYVVRPVIVLSKTALGDTEESIIDNSESGANKIDTNDNIVDDKNETKTQVKVDNTFMSSSIIIIIAGLIIASVSVLIIYKVSNKKR